MYLVLIILIIILISLFQININKRKGARGEYEVAKELKKLNAEEYKVINDVVIKIKNGSSQIDHLIVSIYGIFVVETKYYNGWIHGNQKSEYWTQTIYNDKFKFRNPVKQNWSHIYAMKEVFSDYKSIKYHPIVVFCGNAELKNINTNLPVIYKNQLYFTITERYKEKNISVEDMNNIVETLEYIKNSNRRENKYHIDNVQNNIAVKESNIELLKCPKCGGDLIIRNGKYGKFYGCSNYPSCKYTKKMDE